MPGLPGTRRIFHVFEMENQLSHWLCKRICRKVVQFIMSAGREWVVWSECQVEAVTHTCFRADVQPVKRDCSDSVTERKRRVHSHIVNKGTNQPERNGQRAGMIRPQKSVVGSGSPIPRRPLLDGAKLAAAEGELMRRGRY